jgi:peptidoglycan hydrolase CwlO-like protein
MNQTLLLAIIAAVSSILTILIPKLLPSARRKDAVDMYAELQDKLYSEIERLEKKILQLESKEKEAFSVEEKLTKRIMELEQENKRQAYEIEQLKAELAKHVKNY